LVERRPPKPEVEGSSPSSPADCYYIEVIKMIAKMIEYFKSIKTEMGKVSWMTRPQTVNSTVIVGVFAFIVAIFLFTLDIGLSELVNILFKINL
jgi:preprotein translocase SecE subunit